MPKSQDPQNPTIRADIAGAIFENSHNGVIITDAKGVILTVNAAFTLITGYHADELVGKRPNVLRSERHGKRFYKNMWTRIEHNGIFRSEIWDRHKDGEIFPADLTVVPVPGDNEDDGLYVGILSAGMDSETRLPRKANYDALTGLPNLILFRDRLEFMVAHARRNGQILAVLQLDLDRFKVTNDSLGYTVGDMILLNVAMRLTKVLREVDAVFRLGNDEFAIILEEVSHTEDAAKVAHKILKDFERPFRLPNYERELYLTASIGISLYPNDGADGETLTRNAEAAMYRAKEQGENSYQHYASEMNAKTFERLNMEHQLHTAIKQDEFLVYYQPLVDLSSNRIVAAEALVRWMHPQLGLVSPAEFIPIAEKTGLIIPIGEQVLRKACTMMQTWHESGYPDMRISVNLSARQFQQQNLLGAIDAILDQTGLPLCCLELEITESVGMQNAEMTIRTLEALKAKGIRLSIDDFGTGYSSLSYLKKFPIDTLKIDQSFVRDIPADSDYRTLVTLIISMAHTLNLTVVAEGVETEAQLEFLKKHDCDTMQGYLFSRPLPAEEFEKLLRTKARK